MCCVYRVRVYYNILFVVYDVCICIYILYVLFNIFLQPGGSPYHTIHLADITEGWNFQNLKQHRSNSWSESLDDLKVIQGSFGDSAKNIKYVLRVQSSVLTCLKSIIEKKMKDI